ncbi:NMI protein, partial [Anseranas semipalmata]|nr:NMI protein [Anseranas semipalmata]
MAGRTVQVRGIPTDLPPDRVADKLTIHFLRSRNGGGEIADVQVLPGSQACALITFEALAVAQRILKAKNHVLSIGGKKYPLEVTAHVVELSPDEVVRGRQLLPTQALHIAATAPAGFQTDSVPGRESLHPPLILIRFHFYSYSNEDFFFHT